jgi:hypothetical protein
MARAHNQQQREPDAYRSVPASVEFTVAARSLAAVAATYR